MNVPSETHFDAPNFDESALADLVERLCHGDLTAADAEQLEQLVIANPAARRYYARYLNLHANLPWVVGTADEAASAALEPAPANRSQLFGFLADAVRIVPGGEFVVGGLVLLAVTGAVWGVVHFARAIHHAGDQQLLAGRSVRSAGSNVGSLSTEDRARWSKKSSAPTDATVRIGQRYELAAGWVKIELARGTRISIEGPATWQLESEQRLQLFLGRLAASVPPRAIGFTVATPAGEVVDLGTEFGVLVATGGKTEVHVMQGKVEVKQPRAGSPAANGGMNLPAGKAVRMEVRGNGYSLIALDRRGFAGALQKLTARPGATDAFALDGPRDIRDGTITFQDGLFGYTGTADTYISAGQGDGPDANLGNTDFLPVYEREVDLRNFRRSLIRFDLASLPPGTRIAGATLTLYQHNSGGAQGVTNSLYIVAAANKGWTEGTGTGQANLPAGATWNNTNGSGTPWLGGPGLVAGIDYAANPVATAVTPGTANEAMTFTLNAAGVAAIQKWIDNPSDNSGFFLRQPDGSFSVDHFWSRSAADATLRPTLTLTADGSPEPAEVVH